MVQMSKEFSISSGFEPIDIITLCTIWWPQVKSTDHRPQVSSIYFMRFLRSIQTNITTLLFFGDLKVHRNIDQLECCH